MKNFFNFNKHEVTKYLSYDLDLFQNISESFTFLSQKFRIHKKKNLAKLKWYEGKNYDWAFVQKNDIIFLIRKYRIHYTIVSCQIKEKYKKEDYKYHYLFSKYSAFTFFSNEEKMTDVEKDLICYGDNNFYDINNLLNDLFKLVEDNRIHLIDNKYAFKKPNYVDVELIFTSPESIHKIDLFVFLCEELSTLYSHIYSETTMVDKIKKIKVGDMLDEYTVVVKTSVEVKDEYYHNTGITTKDIRDNKESFRDVYCLSMYYLDEINKLIGNE